MPNVELTAEERREYWGFSHGDDFYFWDYAAPLASILESALEHIEAIFGAELAAAPLRTLVDPVAQADRPTAATWRDVMEDTLSAGTIWPISHALYSAGLYGLYGITQEDVPLVERELWIRDLVEDVTSFAARPEVKVLGTDNAIQRIAAIARARRALDTGIGEVELGSLAILGGISEGRLRNILSGPDPVLERGQDGGVAAVSALAWLQKRNDFHRSIWNRETEAIDPELSEPVDAENLLFVPVAKDGSVFHPGLKRNGSFKIGAKGEEVDFSSFTDALQALNAMTQPRWRRPNEHGNWGIVTGVTWSRVNRTSFEGN